MNKITYSFTTNKNEQETQNAIIDFAKKNNLNITNSLYSIRTSIEKENIIIGLISELKPQDTIIVYDALDLGRSTLEVNGALSAITEKNISLFVSKYNESFKPSNTQDIKLLLKFLQHIESEFEVMKLTDSVGRRRHSNAPLGRPKGRKNNELKLDKHKKDIQKYLDLKISKASIAKLIGCHAQTLYNYIETQKLEKA